MGKQSIEVLNMSFCYIYRVKEGDAPSVGGFSRFRLLMHFVIRNTFGIIEIRYRIAMSEE